MSQFWFPASELCTPSTHGGYGITDGDEKAERSVIKNMLFYFCGFDQITLFIIFWTYCVSGPAKYDISDTMQTSKLGFSAFSKAKIKKEFIFSS